MLHRPSRLVREACMRECRSVQVHECQRYLEVFPCGIVADPGVVADGVVGRTRRFVGRDDDDDAVVSLVVWTSGL